MLSDEAFGGGVRTKNDIDRALSRWFLMNQGLINFSSAKAVPCFFRAQNSAEKNFVIKPKVNLEPSVREMISYFREYPKPK